VTTTKLMQNIVCARMIVVMSFGTPTARNCAARPGAEHDLGGRHRQEQQEADRRARAERYRTSAIAIIVPRTVAMTVATRPMMMLFVNAWQTAPPSTLQTLSHLSSVNPRHEMFDFSESLNENTNVYTIGISRKMNARTV
jgi:hypothetical protein